MYVPLAISLILVSANVFSQVAEEDVSTRNSSLEYDERISVIEADVKFLKEEQERINFTNEGWNLLAIITLIISIIALILNWLGVFGINRIKQRNVDIGTHKQLFESTISQLHINNLHITTMHRRKSLRPSKGAVNKFKMTESDLNFMSYYQSPHNYSDMKNLQLSFRNYNLDIDTAYGKLIDTRINENEKTKIYQSLIDKSSHLIELIIRTLEKIASDNYKDNFFGSKKNKENYPAEYWNWAQEVFQRIDEGEKYKVIKIKAEYEPLSDEFKKSWLDRLHNRPVEESKGKSSAEENNDSSNILSHTFQEVYTKIFGSSYDAFLNKFTRIAEDYPYDDLMTSNDDINCCDRCCHNCTRRSDV